MLLEIAPRENQARELWKSGVVIDSRAPFLGIRRGGKDEAREGEDKGGHPIGVETGG